MIKQTLALIGLTLSLGANADIVLSSSTWSYGLGSSGSSLSAEYDQGFTYGIGEHTLTYADPAITALSAYSAFDAAAAQVTSFTMTFTVSANNELTVNSLRATAGPTLGGIVVDFGAMPPAECDADPQTADCEAVTYTSNTILNSEIMILPTSPECRVTGCTYFDYTPVPSTVPIPAAAWLFGSALLGLGLVKRKKA